MGQKTKIEWTNATWNPIRGCSRVSAGCENCYAEREAHRYDQPGMPYEGLITVGKKGPRWNGKIKFVEEHLNDPLRWRKPRMVFVNSMSDLFHKNVSDEQIADIFNVMSSSPQHIFQVLTKRPERMYEFLSRCANWEGWMTHNGTPPANAYDGTGYIVGETKRWPLPNVWLGVSVEDQKTADERIPLLLETPAAVRWISAEPLLGPIDLTGWLPRSPDWNWFPIECRHGFDACPICDRSIGAMLDWVVVGGESGPRARALNPDWARALRDHCTKAGVPFFFKQWGEWSLNPLGAITAENSCVFNSDENGHEPMYLRDLDKERAKHWLNDYIHNNNPVDDLWMFKVGKRASSRILDGREWNGYPKEAQNVLE